MIKIVKKNKNSLRENLENTFWTSTDNVTITLKDLLDYSKNIPEVNLPIQNLKNHVLSWGDDPEELKKIEKADLKYPILVFINDDNSIKYIVDGNHRVQKAMVNKLPTVKAKLIKFSELPEKYKKVFGQ